MKPSEFPPCSFIEFGKILIEGGLPDHVLNILPCYGHSVGKQICDITGTETGRSSPLFCVGIRPRMGLQ